MISRRLLVRLSRQVESILGLGPPSGLVGAGGAMATSGMREERGSKLTGWMLSQSKLGVGEQALRVWAIQGGFSVDRVDCSLRALRELGAFEPKAIAPALRLAAKGDWKPVQDGPRCLMWMSFPELALFEAIASESECREIIQSAQPYLQPSLVARGSGSALALGRRSRSKSFAKGECAAADALRERIAAMLGVELARVEPLVATQYGEGGFYAPHHDHFHSGHSKWDTPSQRVATVVAYLSEPDQGGQTVIEPLGMCVAPKLGAALYFAYPDESGRELALHASAPCVGEKWVAVAWVMAGGQGALA